MERGWGVNILEDARHSSVLYICKYFVIQVKIPCCPLLEVSASGAVATDNGGVLGRYKQVGEYNGFQHYQVRLH